MNTMYYTSAEINPFVSEGIGDVAIYIKSQIESIKDMIYFDNIVFGEPRKEALEAIGNIYQECNQDNWDGYGAKRINFNSYIDAKNFINILPISIQVPEVTIDSDGNIMFEWFQSPLKIFTICLEGYNKYIFASIFNDEKIHGTGKITGNIPASIMLKLKEFINGN